MDELSFTTSELERLDRLVSEKIGKETTKQRWGGLPAQNPWKVIGKKISAELERRKAAGIR